MKKKKDSFTLAEVLITLAIIGIVASLTIPVTIRKYQEQQTVASVRKFHSEINRALQLAEFKRGKKGHIGFNNTTFINYIRPYLNIVKICATEDKSCFYNGTYKNLNPKYASSQSNISGTRFILKDGQHVAVWIWYSNTYQDKNYNSLFFGVPNFIGYITLDTNGTKAPNQWGVDTFSFALTKNGVIPWGLKKHGDSMWHYCETKRNNGDRENGIFCSGWVVVKGNMDYLRKNVSW